MWATRLLVACLIGLALALPASADSAVTVRVPEGLAVTGSIDTESGPNPGEKWVVVNWVVVINPSRRATQSFSLDDFRLTSPDGTIYLAHPRPNNSVDLFGTVVLAPAASYRANVTFLVPDGLHRADFAFFPKGWYNDYGQPMVYCCLYS